MAISDNGRRLTLRLARVNQAPEEIRKPYSIKALAHRVGSGIPDVNLCPVRAFTEYCSRSKLIRRGRKRLSCHYKKTRREISRETIFSRPVVLVTEALQRAGNDKDLRAVSGVKDINLGPCHFVGHLFPGPLLTRSRSLPSGKAALLCRLFTSEI